MIFTRKGQLSVEGDKNEVLTDLSIICKGLLETKKITKERLLQAVQDAGKTIEEIEEENKKIDKQIEELRMKATEDFLKMLFGIGD